MSVSRRGRERAAGRSGAETQSRALSKARLRLWLRVLKVSRRLEAEIRDRLRVEFNSTLPRFDVMAALDRNASGLRMSELSGVLRVSNGNVTGIVDRLVNDGLVMRVPVEGDRRAMIVRLTRKGREHFAKLATAHEVWVDEILGPIDAVEAEALMSQLGKIAERADRQDGKGEDGHA